MFVTAAGLGGRGEGACLSRAEEHPELRGKEFGWSEKLLFFPMRWRCTYRTEGRTWVLEADF